MLFPFSQIAAHPQRWSLLKALLLLLLIPSISARAQSGGKFDATGTGGNHTIQGYVYLPVQTQEGLIIKVKIDSTNSTGLSVIADANGAFTFRNLEPGPYYLTVDAGEDFEVFKDTINIDREISNLGPRTLTVPVYLRLKPNNPLSNKTVDASLASVPKQSLELYDRARKLAQAGNSKAAIEQLKTAISFYPSFGLAYNEMGVQYLKLGQLEQALEALRSAVKLAPEAFSPRLNYGIALLNKKEFSKAEAELRLALKKNDSSPTAHLYLGMTLISLRKHDEAERELQRAITLGGAEMSLAHYYLGGIYWGKREYKRAADELETYLKLAPQASDAERVRNTIKELRSK
ncbi:MAG: tetratricopeptide repeat protein [Acidobacteria bacterium]|nr:tetratricopeptide repeat protein [Acidobacteriota bacterium]